MPLGKFESNSFRILLSAGYISFQVFDAAKDAVSSLPSNSKSQKAPNSAKFFGSSKSTALRCICNRLHRKQKVTDRTGSPSVRGKLVQAAGFWCILCSDSC